MSARFCSSSTWNTNGDASSKIKSMRAKIAVGDELRAIVNANAGGVSESFLRESEIIRWGIDEKDLHARRAQTLPCPAHLDANATPVTISARYDYHEFDERDYERAPTPAAVSPSRAPPKRGHRKREKSRYLYASDLDSDEEYEEDESEDDVDDDEAAESSALDDERMQQKSPPPPQPIDRLNLFGDDDEGDDEDERSQEAIKSTKTTFCAQPSPCSSTLVDDKPARIGTTTSGAGARSSPSPLPPSSLLPSPPPPLQPQQFASSPFENRKPIANVAARIVDVSPTQRSLTLSGATPTRVRVIETSPLPVPRNVAALELPVDLEHVEPSFFALAPHVPSAVDNFGSATVDSGGNNFLASQFAPSTAIAEQTTAATTTRMLASPICVAAPSLATAMPTGPLPPRLLAAKSQAAAAQPSPIARAASSDWQQPLILPPPPLTAIVSSAVAPLHPPFLADVATLSGKPRPAPSIVTTQVARLNKPPAAATTTIEAAAAAARTRIVHPTSVIAAAPPATAILKQPHFSPLLNAPPLAATAATLPPVAVFKPLDRPPPPNVSSAHEDPLKRIVEASLNAKLHPTPTPLLLPPIDAQSPLSQRDARSARDTKISAAAMQQPSSLKQRHLHPTFRSADAQLNEAAKLQTERMRAPIVVNPPPALLPPRPPAASSSLSSMLPQPLPPPLPLPSLLPPPLISPSTRSDVSFSRPLLAPLRASF